MLSTTWKACVRSTCGDQAASGYRRAVVVADAVHGGCVELVELLFARDLLLFDEDGDADGECVFALPRRADDDDLSFHGLSTAYHRHA